MTFPSGPGQNTKDKSMSIAHATDDPALVLLQSIADAVGASDDSDAGQATAARQDTGNTSLSSIDGKLTSQATAAKQDTSQTTLASILAALVLLLEPSISTPVTPDDATDITATATKGLFVGTTGNVSAKLVGDSSARTWKNVPSGSYIPGAFKAVMTATTAADILALSGP